MSSDAAWKPDPYGRYAMRYHDGSEWTEHVVAGGGTQLVDPMGRSAVIPFAMPKTATGDGGGSGPAWPPPDPNARRG